MSSLNQLTERLASAALLADADDLPGLARLHEHLLAVPGELSKMPELNAGTVSSADQTVRTAVKLVEQVMLRDVKDATTALNSVCEQIAQLQQIIMGEAPALGQTPTPPQDTASAPAPANASAPAASAPITAPQAIREEDRALVTDFIGEANGHLQEAEAALLKLESHPEDQDVLSAIFRSFHTIKGVAGFLNLGQIGTLAHAAESLLDLARKGKLLLVGPPLDITLEAVDAAKAMIRGLDDAVKQNKPPASHPGLDSLVDRLRSAAAGNAAASAGQPAAPAAQAATQAAPADKSAARQNSPEGVVKVTTERLDSLINMVGELVIAQSMVSQDMVVVARGNQKLGRNLSQLGKITRELQDLTMSMRMVPIQGVFSKMSRLVRDLAHKSGKQIDLVITGGETELDRNLVEALADPLVHMVRNSADHGIESPAERLQAGKPACGKVELKAYHQAGNVVVEIIDDGKGLNQQKIVAKARDAGLIRDGQELSEQEIFRLIFHAGLSTADKVTDVSGRGVGMDVVRRNVESLRGRIDIASAMGRGSTFSIRLPLTLAVIDGLIVKVGPERYILPITSIEQSLRPKPAQVSTVQNRGEMCMVRESLLPLVRLHRLFHVQPRTEDACDSIAVIVQDNDRRCCLLVDELLGQQQVVIKSLGETAGDIPGVSGGAILGDGTISLILDVPGLMDLMATS